MAERGSILFILSSPSGVGKTTLSKMMREKYPDMQLSISVTTRPKRPNEVDGVDYRFVTKEKFASMVKNQEFVEYATVYGNSYGTLAKDIEELGRQGKDIIFDVDVQGAIALRNFGIKSGMMTQSVFLLPPSIEAQKARLLKRAQDSITVVEERMAEEAAIEEKSQSIYDLYRLQEYEFAFINDDLQETFDNLCNLYDISRKSRDDLLKFAEMIERERGAK